MKRIPPPSPPKQPQGGLLKLIAGIDSLRRTLGVTLRLRDERRAPNPLWGGHIPEAARAGAELMEAAPHFDRMKFSAKDLGDEAEALRQLEKARDQADELSADLGARIAERKASLTDKVEALRTAVRATIENPQTDPQVAAAVHAASATFRGIFETRVATMLQNRGKTLEARAREDRRVASVSEERDRLALEAQVLRGGTISAPAAPLAAKTGRGRKTRR